MLKFPKTTFVIGLHIAVIVLHPIEKRYICLSTLTSLVNKAPANAAININSELDNITG